MKKLLISFAFVHFFYLPLLASSMIVEQKQCQNVDFPEPPCCGRSFYNQNQNKNARIYHGQIAGPKEFPWIVYLNDTIRNWSCTGSLINSRWVLTAAHCLTDNNPDNYEVHLGEWNIFAERNCTDDKICAPEALKIGSDKLIRHELYKGEPPVAFHDIALLRLKESVAFNEFVQPICLWSKEMEKQSLVGKVAIAAGFGKMEDNITTGELRKVSVNILNSEEYQEIYNQVPVTKYHIYTDFGKEGACAGDSGGPLSIVLTNEEQRNTFYHFEVGVFVVMATDPTKPNAKICGQGYPDIYMRVSEYIDWIKDQIRMYK